MVVDAQALEELVAILRSLKPEILITHTPVDPFNPDHPVASQVVQKARLLASGAGVDSAFERITPPELYFFEPHQPELCEFIPNTFVDITAVFEQKQQAMECITAQDYLKDYYSELAARRGNHARRISGMKEVRYAEALQRALPRVVKFL